MPTFLIKLPNPDDAADHRYLEWSTIVDAPISYGMTALDLVDHIRERYGYEGLRQLPDRLRRCAANGHSGKWMSTWQDEIACNRAGPNESHLNHRGIWEAYVVQREEP